LCQNRQAKQIYFEGSLGPSVVPINAGAKSLWADCEIMEHLVRLGISHFLSLVSHEVAIVSSKVAYLHVKKAAELLGVSPNTIRAWGAAGKIAEYRHPVNNYRLYRSKDIRELVKRLQRPLRTNRIRKPR
jgi:hypothetical protein